MDSEAPVRRTRKKVAQVATLQDLDGFVPSKDRFTAYKDRGVRGWEFLSLLHYARMASENVLISGPTGSGKTSAAIAYGAQHGLPVILIPGNATIDTTALFGRPWTKSDGTLEFILGPVTRAVQNGNCVLVLDEINLIHPKVYTALYPLLTGTRMLSIPDHPQSMQVRAGDGLLIVATMNPGYEGTRELSYALKNRFEHVVHFGYDPDVEAALVDCPALMALAERIRSSKQEITTPLGTNRLITFEAHAFDLGTEYAFENLLAYFADYERESVRNVVNLLRPDIVAWYEANTPSGTE